MPVDQSAAAAARPRDLHRSVWIRIAVSFGQRFTFILLMPVMTVVLARGVGGVAAGLLLGALAALEVGAGLVAGRLADSLGRRPVLLVAEATAVAGYGVMVVAVAGEWPVAALFASYGVAAVAGGFALPASDATIVDRTGPEQRELTYTILYWTTNLALASGALLGGALYPGRFALLVLIALVISVLSVLATFFLIPESRPVEEPADPVVSPDPFDEGATTSGASGYGEILRDGFFLALVVAASLRSALEVQVNYYGAVRIAEQYEPTRLLGSLLSWRPDAYELLGLLRAENTVLVVVAAFVVRAVVKSMGTHRKLMVGSALFVVGTLPLAVSNTAWVLLVGIAVLTLGELVAAPTQQTLAPLLAPARSRTRYLAVYNANLRIGMVLASLSVTLGELVGPTGMVLTYLLAGAAILVLLHHVTRSERVA